MKSLLLILSTIFISAIFVRAEELSDWLGPDIPSLQIKQGANGVKCVDDILQAVNTIGPVSLPELQKLGLGVGEEGKVTTINPPTWPSDPASKMIYVDGILIVSAWDRELQSLKALLTLQRNGYAIPTINSEQLGVGQPATVPQLESESGDKPQPAAEVRSR